MPADHTDEIYSLKQHLGENARSIVFARLADRYLKMDEVDKAIEICTEGLSYHPKYSTGHFILARCFYAQKHYDLAEKRLKKVLSIEPHFLSAHKLYSQLMADIGWHKSSEMSLEKIRLIDPLYSHIEEDLAVAKAADQAPVEEPLVSDPGEFTEENIVSKAADTLEETEETLELTPLDDEELLHDTEDQIDLDYEAEYFGEEEARFSEILDDIFSPSVAEEEQLERETKEALERAAGQEAASYDSSQDLDNEDIEKTILESDIEERVTRETEKHDLALSFDQEENSDVTKDLEIDRDVYGSEQKEPESKYENEDFRPLAEESESDLEGDAFNPVSKELKSDDESNDFSPIPEKLNSDREAEVFSPLSEDLESDQEKVFDAESRLEAEVFTPETDESDFDLDLEPIKTEDFDLEYIEEEEIPPVDFPVDEEESAPEDKEISGFQNQTKEFGTISLDEEDEGHEDISQFIAELDNYDSKQEDNAASDFESIYDPHSIEQVEESPFSESMQDTGMSQNEPQEEMTEDAKEKFVTPTLGDIYAAQGQYGKAIIVYERLLKSEPDNERFKIKLDYLRKKLEEQG